MVLLLDGTHLYVPQSDVNLVMVKLTEGSFGSIPCLPTSPNISVRLTINGQEQQLGQGLEYFPSKGYQIFSQLSLSGHGSCEFSYGAQLVTFNFYIDVSGKHAMNILRQNVGGLVVAMLGLVLAYW